jgi:DNA-binding MarR family transcriptional regulator
MHRDKNVNPEQVLERSLRALSVGSYLFQCRVAAELNLHPTDLQALHTLGMHATGMPAGDLAVALGLTSGATTALIDRLAGLGFAARTRDPQDRRRVIVRLHEAGTAPLKAKYRQIDQRVRKLIAQRSTAELEVIASFLAELVSRDSAP